MSKLEKAYYKLQQPEMQYGTSAAAIDTRVNIAVTLVYLVVMLSVPIGKLSMLVWFALYPILGAAIAGISFGGIFLKSLYIVPLAALIGMFNPIYDRTVAFHVAGIGISTGWISFCSIILRGMMAIQAILILIESCGFIGLCRGLHRLGVPAFLTDQLQFVYRYMTVLMVEALSMRRAREARGYGKKRFPIKLWGTMIGQLFLRTIDRSERINRAMLARGFNGTIPEYACEYPRMNIGSWVYLLLMTAGIVALRIFDLSLLFSSIHTI